MTRDIETLRAYLRVIVVVVAVCATSLPLVYSLSHWRARPLGKLIMWLAVTLAMAVDFTVLFMVWAPKDILIVFWIDAIILAMIGGSTASLAFYIWRVNHIRERVYFMLFSDKLYQVIKKAVQIYIPALSAFYFGLSQIWGLMYGIQVTGTMALVATFLGLLLGISTKTYEKQGPVIDGEFMLAPDPGGDTANLHVKNADLEALETKEYVVFKVHRPKVERVE